MMVILELLLPGRATAREEYWPYFGEDFKTGADVQPWNSQLARRRAPD
jgi:hypothetical protein